MTPPSTEDKHIREEAVRASAFLAEAINDLLKSSQEEAQRSGASLLAWRAGCNDALVNHLAKGVLSVALALSKQDFVPEREEQSRLRIYQQMYGSLVALIEAEVNRLGGTCPASWPFPQGRTGTA